MPEIASEVLRRMQSRTQNSKQVVSDWRKQIPSTSRWFPGCPGDPFCLICEGTGYIRFDLKIGHPDFGKVFLCDCAANKR